MQSTKKVLFLGAAPTQIPPIEYAVEQGHYVITCDYRPDNPGHALAHESHDVSTTDKEAVLRLARELNIDGIVAYASDPAAPTAAYIAEMLNLPGNPYESVMILSRKDKFREFLRQHSFNTPKSRSFRNKSNAREWLSEITLPAFVKPVDSSGSKGITLLNSINDFSTAFDHAAAFSLEKKVVIEERINKVGYQIDSDVFMKDGELQFWIWGDSHFNHHCSPPFQMASSFPSHLSHDMSHKASRELERILKLLGMVTGAFNIEFIVDENDEIWFLEIGARNGGGRISDAIRLATDIDLTKHTVDAALGDGSFTLFNKKPIGFWSDYMLHSLESGILEEIWLSDELREKIYEQDIWAKPGDDVRSATGSHDVLGTMILNFTSQEEMLDILGNINEHVKVRVRKDRGGLTSTKAASRAALVGDEAYGTKWPIRTVC